VRASGPPHNSLTGRLSLFEQVPWGRGVALGDWAMGPRRCREGSDGCGLVGGGKKGKKREGFGEGSGGGEVCDTRGGGRADAIAVDGCSLGTYSGLGISRYSSWESGMLSGSTWGE
jgi:hypothetical protein